MRPTLTANNNNEEGIDFQSVSGHVVLSGCMATGNGGEGIDVDTADGRLAIDGCVASNNGDDGLEIGEDAAIPGVLMVYSDLSGNAGDGIDLKNVYSTVAFHCVNLADNGDAGLQVDTPATVYADGNWWGSPTGPMHPSNPGGTGDRVVDSADGGSGTVDFAPVLSAPCLIGLNWADTNCDGDVDEVDALAVGLFLAQLEPVQELDCPAAEEIMDLKGFLPRQWFDVNCDAVIDGEHLLYILRHRSALHVPQPPTGCPNIGEEVVPAT